MQLDYVDLFLLHWPVKTRVDIPGTPVKEEDFFAIRYKVHLARNGAMHGQGLTKAIGLSNFSSKKIEGLPTYLSGDCLNYSS